MPATAGRVRMPANNRVHSSAALQTHGIWQSAIGYDPYAPNKEEDKTASQPKAASSEAGGDNAYASFQGLLALARITGSNADEARGSCKRCGWVGHLSFQCRNFLSTKDEKDKDLSGDMADGLSELEKLKKRKNASESSEEEEESESSDSDYDSEMEKIIAKRSGRSGKKDISVKKKITKDEDDSDSDSDSDSGRRKKRGRSKKKKSGKRRSEDSDDSDDGRRKSKKKSKKRDDSSDEEDERRRRRHRKSRKEKRRRRSHHDESESDSSEDSERRHKRKSRRSPDSSLRDETRVGGRDMKRSEKSRKRRYDNE